MEFVKIVLDKSMTQLIKQCVFPAHLQQNIWIKQCVQLVATEILFLKISLDVFHLQHVQVVFILHNAFNAQMTVQAGTLVF